jgi:23S rRNA pseudouridine1911/1915/1917 synthase
MHFTEIEVHSSEAGERLDTFLSKKTGITRSRIQKLVTGENVLVNGKNVGQSYRIKADDLILLGISEEKPVSLIPESIPINILYEDEYLIVVEKPPGMVVYPAAGHSRGTLMNALACLCKNLSAPGGPLRPGIVHRLDKDTSGVMVIALNEKVYYSLVEQFKKKTIKRKYVALIYGNVKEDEGEINMKIGRSESDRKKMSTRIRKGKEAVTKWKVLRRFREATLIEARLGTGRTHQIRVHFASIGYPVLGDRTYGRKTEVTTKSQKRIIFPRQMLHAELLGFIHPETREYLEFSSSMPEDMSGRINELVKDQ